MKLSVTISILFFSIICHAQIMVLGVKVPDQSAPVSVTAQFNFNLTARNETGWADVTGHPHTAVRSATQNGITISTRSTSLWTNVSGTTAVQNGGEETANPSYVFPQNVVLDYFFSNQTSCADGNEQLQISGLTPGAQYTVRVLGSRNNTNVGDATRNCIYVLKDANGRTTQTLNVKQNTANYAEFLHAVADASGNLYLGAYGANDTGGAVYGYFNGLKISSE